MINNLIPLKIRQLTRNDISEVLQIQRQVYPPELNEGEKAFLYKMNNSEITCLGAFHQTHLCAYIFAQPYPLHEIIALDNNSHPIPKNPDCMYIHDLAISPPAKHQGIGSALVKSIEDIAKKMNIQYMGLVSVQNSEEFWKQQSFEEQRRFHYLPTVPAVYMIKKISTP